uniref:NADH-ubiquinone oxidoreductase chain 2 n=1 Tax=Protopterus aethiopicus TaxID=7886 RepID=E3WCM4_PROAT|nr:NADH dehydrogenase subunit 2 [Protopterus aethiopicus]BAJ40851.1 NADH dehydrogenase subunit 2 [Protopterus aethiopicus]
MSPTILSVLIMSLGLGTTVTFMSSNWLLAWVGLEINTMSIIPLMSQHHHPRATEAATKYFLAQAAASIMILFSSLINAWTAGEWNITNLLTPTSATLIALALAIKIGLAPMHFWLPEVLQGLTLMTGAILTTWQKLAPFILLYQISDTINPTLLLLLGLLSTLMGGWSGLNQTHLRKILAYSSIAHMGWMTMILPFAPNLALLNLAIYITLTLPLFLTLNTCSSATISSLALNWTKSPPLMTMLLIILLSLGGLPPLTGFVPKWLILQELTNNGLYISATVAALSALLSLYFYLRLCYTTSLTTAPNVLNNNHWRPNTWMYQALPMILIFATALLPLTPTLLV